MRHRWGWDGGISAGKRLGRSLGAQGEAVGAVIRRGLRADSRSGRTQWGRGRCIA